MRELQDRGRRRFRTERSCFGRTFRQPATKIKANHLIFILSGEVSITKDSKEETRVRAGEFIFIPLSSHYTGTVIQPGTYISLSFFHDAISLCDKHMLSSYLDEVQHTPLCFEPLSVRAPWTRSCICWSPISRRASTASTCTNSKSASCSSSSAQPTQRAK